MKKISEVMNFYYESIYPKVLNLELERLVVVKKILKLRWILGTILAIGSLFVFIFNTLMDSITYICSLGIFIFMIYLFFQNLFSKRYVSGFKDEVLAKIIKFLDPNLTFDKLLYISSFDYQKSHIFKKKFDRYNGNDLVSGVIDQTKILFSDLHTEYKVQGEKKVEWVTIFKGIFFIADFNKEINGELFVLPDKITKNLGHIASFFQGYNKKHGDLAKMDNPEFEKNFVVYTSNQITARYILTHSMMERILRLKKQVGVEIYLSFIGTKIYIAIAYNEDKFEADPFKSLKNFIPIRNYVETLTLLLSIIDDFKLNDRLWSR